MAEYALARRLAEEFNVQWPLPPHGPRRPDLQFLVPAHNPEYNLLVRVENKTGYTTLNEHIRRQMAADNEARNRNAADGLEGELRKSGGRVLRNFGRVARPVGIALDAIDLGSAFQADGNRIGKNTGRAASGIAGGALGGWAGAAGGAAIGTAILPGPGTVAGGLIGGLLGAYGGDLAGRGIYDGNGSKELPSLPGAFHDAPHLEATVTGYSALRPYRQETSGEAARESEHTICTRGNWTGPL